MIMGEIDTQWISRKAIETLGDEYNGLVNEVLGCKKFLKCSGSSGDRGHHYGKGMLLTHTREVMQLAMSHANEYEAFSGNTINLRNLFFAALYHDYGKTYDYEIVNKNNIQKTDHYHKIRHISRSFQVWEEKAKYYDYPDTDIEEVSHAILSHHMLPQWGSPVGPQTKLAWILHLADQASAQLGAIDSRKKIEQKEIDKKRRQDNPGSH